MKTGEKEVLTPFTDAEELHVRKKYNELRASYLASHHRKKVAIIDKAFDIAHQAHYGVRRKSGEPYILHPIEVARIVCEEMGLGSTSICCALLHDVVEDTEYTVDDLRELFTDNIARIVDGVTKVEVSEKAAKSIQTENYRKLLLTTADDARVILIKLADRLHNMRTLGSMSSEKKSKITGETQFIYAPLAHRLGLFAIKTELEELCFFYEYPEKYEMIKQKVEAIIQDEADLLERFSSPIEAALSSKGIRFKLLKRIKSYYSIWSKMQEKSISFEDIYDIFAVRIIYSCEDGYPEMNRAWDIYTIIGKMYRVHPERLRDWMSSPKLNGYQALHATYMSFNGRWIEVQIRSERMDAIAEQGVAAHWRYKAEDQEEDNRLDEWLDTIRTVLGEPTPSSMDFLDNLKLSLYTTTINVFTPKGKSVALPAGATVLDFAYAIHSSLGDRCIGAKVNHRVVPISTKLQDSDQVQILDSATASPQAIWLNYVKTIHAKYKIKEALRRQKKELVAKGERMVVDFFEDLGYQIDASVMDRLAHSIVDVTIEVERGRGGHKLLEAFFEQLGTGHIALTEELRYQMGKQVDALSVNSLAYFFSQLGIQYWLLEQASISTDLNKKGISRKETYVLRETEDTTNYVLAKCCNPILGDDVLGVLDNNVVEVHDKHCAHAIRLKSTVGDRLISTEWGEHQRIRFEIPMIIKGVDTVGVLHAITQVLLDANSINITRVCIDTKDGIFQGEITLRVPSLQEFERIKTRLMCNPSIVDVIRKTGDLSTTNRCSYG